MAGSSLALYLEPSDLRLLVDRINLDADLAWLVSSSDGGWRSCPVLQGPVPASALISHVSTGPLPNRAELDGAAVFALRLCIRNGPGTRPGQNTIGLTSFGWARRGYGRAGAESPNSIWNCWTALRRWVIENGVRVRRVGPLEVNQPDRLDAFAFPAALAAMRSGIRRDHFFG